MLLQCFPYGGRRNHPALRAGSFAPVPADGILFGDKLQRLPDVF